MGFKILIDQFEGPLDLMLHLIREHKLDLMDLNISELTDQYILYIEAMKQQKLEIAAEYLSELAGLVEIKSKRLLPRQEEAEIEEEGYQKSLVQRLLEYQQFKDVALHLNERFIERYQQFNIPSNTQYIEQLHDHTVVYDHDIYDLIKAMSRVMLRFQKTSFQEVSFSRIELSVDDRIDQVRLFLRNTPHSFTLTQLFEQNNNQHFQIVTFLAILDMIRMNEIIFSIREDDDEIILKGV